MVSFFVVATWLFLIANLDTFVVLTAFCADDRYEPREILLGHYLGFGSGLAMAVVAAAVATELL